MPYQMLFDQAALGIISFNASGRWLKANQKFCQLLGYAEEELLKLTFQDVIHPEDRAASLALFQCIVLGEIASSSREVHYVRQDETLLRLKLTLSACGHKASHNYAILGFVEVLEELAPAELSNTLAIYELPSTRQKQDEAELSEREALRFTHSIQQLPESEKGRSMEPLLAELEKLELQLSTSADHEEIRTLGQELAALTRNVLDYALAERNEAVEQVTALRKAKTQMEDFLSVASHELRTPLTTIKANTQLAMRRLKGVLQRPELLLEGTGGKVQASFEMLERVERQVGVLNRLVGDMLDVSRIQGNRLQIHINQEPYDLVPIIAAAVREQHKAMPERTINVSLPEGEQILVKADPDRLGQVLNNYLLNALKYSEAHEPVAVGVQLEKAQDTGVSQVRVTVQDKGPGIAPEEQARIWECFYQSPTIKVCSGSGVGMGLGLHICQTLIERQGGHVGVMSVPDEGSVFWFTLPLAQMEVEREATEN
ncbi:sensor histidine kinase [Dictyobacter kobayashii]|nr:HAMP domain-containing sensor histidine kinase [Dictyobacter kobayashii]